MSIKPKKRIGVVQFLRAFLPLQLVFNHFKYNLLALIYWAILFLIVSDQLGSAFGIPILFYSPEYLGNVSPVSFGLVGFALGGFIMAFNTYSYRKLGNKYPFLIMVQHPFLKFCKNNSIIPLLFIVFYLYKMARFQSHEEYTSWLEVALFCLSTILGISLFLLLSFAYFFPFSRTRNFFKPLEEDDDLSPEEPVESFTHKLKNRRFYQLWRTKNRSYIYVGRGIKFLKSRSIEHIDPSILEKILMRNKINTSVFELLTIISFVILGLFSGYKLFEMPAAMSIVLLITMILMLFSALHSWFGRWTYFIVIGVLVAMNFLSIHSSYFTFKNYAYGLNYQSSSIPEYTIDAISKSTEANENQVKSHAAFLETLKNWKIRTGEKKPKLIIVNTSGGGSRSAVWTFGVLQKLDQELNGKLKTSIQMITGASGGMIGASYFRELVLRSKKNEISDFYTSKYRENLGKDLLNKLSFAASTNDIFFRYQKITYNNLKYPKDRGYAFEEQLNENTDHVMNHNLAYYYDKEKKGDIPTMIFTPTVVNDGRRLLIGSQNLGFLTNGFNHGAQVESFENIDYQTFFEALNPGEMRFTSVMRSSSTFPFVMPMVTMPTKPEIQLMDAGIRDNYGGKITIEYLKSIQDWIQENTSGVIILQIRDTRKVLKNEFYTQVSFIDKITMPFGNVYKNFPRTQDFDQEQLFNSSLSEFPFPVDQVAFNLREFKTDRISLSWHLSKQEKNKIENAFNSPSNKLAQEKMRRLLGE